MKIGDRVKLIELPKGWGLAPAEMGTIQRIEKFKDGKPAYVVRFDLGGATFYLGQENIALADSGADEVKFGIIGDVK